MALGHVRDYVMAGAEQDPLANPDVGVAVFFTRWITHFCAPVFAFLAGTSAGLMSARRSPSALGGFLLTRGLWLVVIEIVVIATAWTFAPWGMTIATVLKVKRFLVDRSAAPSCSSASSHSGS